MNELLIILFSIFGIGLIISTFFSITRDKLINALEVDNIRIKKYVIENRVRLDSDMISYLRGFDNALKNNEMLDIQVLSVMTLNIDKAKIAEGKQRFERINSKVPQELKEITDNFNKTALTLIKISALKPDFIWWALKSTIVRSFFKLSFIPSKKFVKAVNETLKNTFVLRNPDLDTGLSAAC